MRDDTRNLYQCRLAYLLHHNDVPRLKLALCDSWLTELSRYPALRAQLSACRDALRGIVAARPRRGSFVYRTRTTWPSFSEEKLRAARERLAARMRE